jgi:prefoldin subunit 5
VDTNDHLAHHDAQLQHLVALNVKMVDAIERLDGANDRLTAAIERIDGTLERLTANLEVVTQLLQRQRNDDHRNGH